MTRYKKCYRSIAFLLSVFFVLFTISGCEKKYSDVEICNTFLDAVVEVAVFDEEHNIVGTATGIVINNDGLILTNRHVIKYFDYSLEDYTIYNKISIRYHDEENYTDVQLVKESHQYDLALLKTTNLRKKYFVMSNNELHYGEVVHTIGNGNGYGLAYSKGNVAAPLRQVNYEKETILAIQLSMSISDGNSGGPLINEKGELVGITTFRLRNRQNEIIYGTSFALPIETIKDFLSE